MDKMGRDTTKKTQRLYRCRSNYALSKLTADNVFEDLWRREDPESCEFIRYNMSFGSMSRIHRVYTDVKIPNNTKINHIIISYSDQYNAIPIDRLLPKTEIGKTHDILIILHVNVISRICFLY